MNCYKSQKVTCVCVDEREFVKASVQCLAAIMSILYSRNSEEHRKNSLPIMIIYLRISF
jgi:hypothetical protein